MGTKKSKYNKTDLKNLPNNKPVLYRIETGGGNLNYVGTAKRGRVQDRIEEHIGEIPGATVRVEQFDSINEARKKETRVIKRSKPKYNERVKQFLILTDCYLKVKRSTNRLALQE
jgi:excinuclease UvrABC nuclease subunit